MVSNKILSLLRDDLNYFTYIDLTIFFRSVFLICLCLFYNSVLGSLRTASMYTKVVYFAELMEVSFDGEPDNPKLLK